MKQKINDGHYLEALDRLHVQIHNIEVHLLEHPVVEKHKDVREEVIRAIVRLVEAYQLVGKHTQKLKKKKT